MYSTKILESYSDRDCPQLLSKRAALRKMYILMQKTKKKKKLLEKEKKYFKNLPATGISLR